MGIVLSNVTRMRRRHEATTRSEFQKEKPAVWLKLLKYVCRIRLCHFVKFALGVCAEGVVALCPEKNIRTPERLDRHIHPMKFKCNKPFCWVQHDYPLVILNIAIEKGF